MKNGNLDEGSYANGMMDNMAGTDWSVGVYNNEETQVHSDSYYVGWCDSEGRRDAVYYACCKRLKVDPNPSVSK